MQQADAPIAARTAPIPSHPGCLNDFSVLLEMDGFFTSSKFIDLFLEYVPYVSVLQDHQPVSGSVWNGHQLWQDARTISGRLEILDFFLERLFMIRGVRPTR